MVLRLESLWSWQGNWGFAILSNFRAWTLLVYVRTCVHARCVSTFCLVLLNYYLGQSLRAMNFIGYPFNRNKIIFLFP